MNKIMSGVTRKEVYAIVRDAYEKLENKPTSKQDYEYLLKEQDLDLYSAAYAEIARDIVNGLNIAGENNLSIYDLNIESYVDIEKSLTKIITFDEFKDMLKVARNYVLGNDLSYRELVMIEMAWMGSSPQQIVEVLEDDVQIVKLPDVKAIYYIVNNKEFYFKDEDFVKDFEMYKKEVKAGAYKKMRKMIDKEYVTSTQYADSEYFIKKTIAGKSGIATSKKFVRNETAIASFLEVISAFYKNNRIDCSKFSVQNFIDSACVYKISQGAPREEIESRYASYIVPDAKNLQLEFFEILSKRLYGSPLLK